MRLHQFPFSAIVGQEPMKTALILNAVDPSISGVLIRGHKGTGKSTAARAFAQLLPEIEVVEDCPFNSDPRAPVERGGIEIEGHARMREPRTVLRPMPYVELPLNATEDRLVGSLHIEKALRTGRRSFEPGLLAAANRGILYVDEVNLLEDHLVDMLLDSAASGCNIIEREGISFVHPARFILIGTMNPEEGELRPQFLDRFGLCAVIDSIQDPGSREAIIRRRLSFDEDPGRFLRDWEAADRLVSHQITLGRERLAHVRIPDDQMALAVRLCQSLQVQGHRADLTILKAARAHAAFLEKCAADADDVAAAARLAVPHRVKASPLDSMEAIRQKIDGALREISGERESSECPTAGPELEDLAEQMQVPGSMAAGSILFSFLAKKETERVFEADQDVGSAEIDVDRLLTGNGGSQKRSKAATVARSGRYRQAVPVREGERDYDVALDATLRRSAMRHVREGSLPEEGRALEREDLCKKKYSRPGENLIVFVVDSSDSMGSGAEVRMKAAKGAALALLRKAYQNRSTVAMVAFGGEEARVALPPTTSVDCARRFLEHLPTGGATPFADGLMKAWQLVRSERLKNPRVRPVLVIISDGEANVPISEGVAPLEELGRLAEKIGRDGISAVFIDAASEPAKCVPMRQIAVRMQASYVTLRSLTASRVIRAVRDR